MLLQCKKSLCCFFISLSISGSAVLLPAAHAQLSATAETAYGLQGQNIRRFPDNALRAQLVVTLAPEVTIDGKAQRLAPGSRIYNERNTILMPASVTGQKYVVNYTRDLMGQVKDVWILTPEEMKLKAPNVLKAEMDKQLQQQIQQSTQNK